MNLARVTIYGLLWGLATTAMESLQLPLGKLGAGQLLVFHLRVLPHLCMAGFVLALVSVRMAGRQSDALLAAWVLVGFPAVSVSLALFSSAVLDPTGYWASSVGSELHTCWTSLVHGSIFTFAYRLHTRAERTRAQLAQSEIARQQAEAVLMDARFSGLRGQIDPAFLLRVAVEAQARYQAGRAGADRLLDGLVDFLRIAMPGVRSGTSTLGAEAQLVTQYSRLLCELGDARRPLEVRVDGPMPNLAFPSLLMLPIVDQLGRAAGGAPLELRIRSGDGACDLVLSTPAPGGFAWLSAETTYRLQVGLRVLFRDDWRLTVSDAPPRIALALASRLADPLPPSLHMEASYA